MEYTVRLARAGRGECEVWLRGYLGDRLYVPAETVVAAAAQRGFTRATVYRAARKLRVVRDRVYGSPTVPSRWPTKVVLWRLEADRLMEGVRR